MKGAIENDDRKLLDLFGLSQGQCFKEFIKRAESAGHENETNAVFHKANFTIEEVMKIKKSITGEFLKRELGSMRKTVA